MMLDIWGVIFNYATNKELREFLEDVILDTRFVGVGRSIQQGSIKQGDIRQGNIGRIGKVLILKEQNGKNIIDILVEKIVAGKDIEQNLERLSILFSFSGLFFDLQDMEKMMSCNPETFGIIASKLDKIGKDRLFIMFLAGYNKADVKEKVDEVFKAVYEVSIFSQEAKLDELLKVMGDGYQLINIRARLNLVKVVGTQVVSLDNKQHILDIVEYGTVADLEDFLAFYMNKSTWLFVFVVPSRDEDVIDVLIGWLREKKRC